jgi:addiction module HigA family antidote
MIHSFACSDTEALFHSQDVPRFKNIERVARRKLLQLHAATELNSLRVPPGNRLEALKDDRKGHTASASTINGGCASCGRRMVPIVWKSSITTKRAIQRSIGMTQLLDEIHPGEILLEDFMKPMGITARQLAADIDVSPSRISDLVHGSRPITADTALRLGLFFGMEPRFWLNLQSEYDMRMAMRNLTDKIAPRIRVFHRVAA